MFKKLIWASGVVVVAAVFGLGYLGFVPVISRLLGTDQPRDLGVVFYADEHVKSAFAKASVTQGELPFDVSDAESVKYEGKVDIKAEFTQEELTSFFNDCRWDYCPVSSVQLRINADGSVEMSGLLRFDHMEGYGQRFKIPQDRILEGLNALKLAPDVLPFYVKGAPSAKDGDVSLGLSSVEFGRLPIPTKQVETYRGEVDAAIEGLIPQVPGMSVKSLDFSGGTMKFEGSYPAKQSFRPQRPQPFQ
jgi:hypothetical protein